MIRGFFATISLIFAIGGLLVVIGYGASTAFLNLSDRETNLYDRLLMGDAAPAGWTATQAVGVDYTEEFIAPCLQTALMEGVSTSGRGAANYSPGNGPGAPVRAMVVQTSRTNARAIMDDVARDTENNCQRGVTVGTVENARVEPLDLGPVDEALEITFDRQQGDETISHFVVVFRDGDTVGQMTREATGSQPLADQDAIDLAVDLGARVDSPPSDAALAAAGVLDQRTTVEKFADWAKAETGSLLTADGRYPVGAGLGAFGGIVLLLYVAGARLSRPPAERARASKAKVSGITSEGPKLMDYGTGEQTVYKAHSAADEMVEESDHDLAGRGAAGSGPIPILDFPQKTIEEKLKILKAARLKEPRREHKAVRQVSPVVEWTHEITREEQTKRESVPAETPPGQVSRKVLMKKLRSGKAESQ